MAARKDQPCWSCTKACGGCCWSQKGEPVPGWKAKARQQAGVGNRDNITTYSITKCPEYEPDLKAIEWEKSFGITHTGRPKKRGTQGGLKQPLRATSVRTGEVKRYESFAAAAKDGFYAQKINMVIAGTRSSHHGWTFERLEDAN